MIPAQWEHKTTILGFTQVNNAHNGQRLGQALFKICRHVGILHKVWMSSFTWCCLIILTPLSIASKIGHITCDNASNNSTMMEEFAARLKAVMGKRYKWRKQKIKWVMHAFTRLFKLITSPLSCLAHVINLATQALIVTYSKSPHFNPKNPEAHIPTSCDEVGLVRAIVVKVCLQYILVVYCWS